MMNTRNPTYEAPSSASGVFPMQTLSYQNITCLQFESGKTVAFISGKKKKKKKKKRNLKRKKKKKNKRSEKL